VACSTSSPCCSDAICCSGSCAYSCSIP
jgi:hypothetical protein